MLNKIHLIGNAHIDPAWFWRWQEGYAEIKATFRSALDRIGEYPGFIFTSAAAAYYKWIEDNEPAMFKEIQQRVAEGRWCIAGGMWIQPDCNIPSGESFARHFLLSQRYFLEKFGKAATVGYNVDSFGHNGSLPKIFNAAGIDSYVMMRPGSHENPDVPAGAFWWESTDGSRVLAFRIDQENGYCNGSDYDTNRRRIDKCISESRRLGIPFMCFYGVGNHGGGPTIQMLNNINAMQKEPEGEKLIFSNPRRYFDELHRLAPAIPVRKTDLQWHASGCYSTMSATKAHNRKAENRLVQAEIFASLAQMNSLYHMPGELMDRAWQGVLFNQFHDIMGGCSAREAYDDALELYGQSLSIAAEVANSAVQALSWNVNTMDENRIHRSKESDWSFWELDNMGTPIVVFNPLSWRREIPVQLIRPVKSVCDDNGKPVPLQIIRASRTNTGDKWDSLFVADVPAMGYAVYWVYVNKKEDIPSQSTIKAEGAVIENEYLRLEINAKTGHIQRLYDKAAGKEVFEAPAGVPLVIDIEHCDTWGHNVFSFRDVCGRFESAKVTLLESGPVRAKLRVKSEYGHSSLTQDYILYAGSKELKVEAILNWQEKFKMLKLSFPVNVKNDTATYDIPYGTINRPVTGTEEAGQMWFDISDGEYGLSVLNNSKYSFDVLGSEMRMTVANSSLFADHYGQDHRDETCEFLDQGIQRFAYALLPHKGNWNADTVRAAYELNTEETHVNETYHQGPLPRRYEGINLSAKNVVVTALKPAYGKNGYIVRMCEYEGRDTNCTVTLPAVGREFTASIPKFAVKTYFVPDAPDADIVECDLLENKRG